MVNTQDAQTWLQKYYDKNKDTDSTLIKLDNDKNSELKGELIIDGDKYPMWKTNLTKIDLNPMAAAGGLTANHGRVGLLTKLTIKNCPLINELNVNYNQLTELDISNLPNLKNLSFSFNQVNKINVTNTNNIENIFFLGGDLQEVEMIGIENSEKISIWNGGLNNGVVIPFKKIRLSDLKEVIAGLNINQDKITDKSPEEIKGLIKEEGNKKKEDQNKLNESIPGLINEDGRVNGSKLAEIKDNLANGNAAQALLDQLGIGNPKDDSAAKMINELKQLQNDLQELNIDKNNLKAEVTKLRHDLTYKTKENQLRKKLFEAMRAGVRGISNNMLTQVENSNQVKAALTELTKLIQQAQQSQVEVPPKS